MDRSEQWTELIGEWLYQQQTMGVLLQACVDDALCLYQERQGNKWHVFAPYLADGVKITKIENREDRRLV